MYVNNMHAFLHLHTVCTLFHIMMIISDTCNIMYVMLSLCCDLSPWTLIDVLSCTLDPLDP